ncbi:hypothetical protein [Streptomyces sp. NPDC020917]|uniref:hypothetical protein n=1 Tax=Streptomyces sp. NPDC020917 TaxID=3365102 RepID=UPI0037914DB3
MDTGPQHFRRPVRWRPTADWNVLQVTDMTAYRWLRYVGPSGGRAQTGEVQFLTAPASALQVSVRAPASMDFTGGNTVTAVITNGGSERISGVRPRLSVASVNDTTALSSHLLSGPVNLAPGRQAIVRWRVSLPLAATVGGYRVQVDAAVPGSPGARATATTQVDGPSVDAVPGPVRLAPGGAGQPVSTAMQLTNHWSRPIVVQWRNASPDYVGSGVLEPGRVTVPPHATVTAQVIVRPITAGPLQVPLTVTDVTGAEAVRWDVQLPIVQG